MQIEVLNSCLTFKNMIYDQAKSHTSTELVWGVLAKGCVSDALGTRISWGIGGKLCYWYGGVSDNL